MTTIQNLTAHNLCARIDACIAQLRKLRRIARAERDALTPEERQSQRAQLLETAENTASPDPFAAEPGGTTHA